MAHSVHRDAGPGVVVQFDSLACGTTPKVNHYRKKRYGGRMQIENLNSLLKRTAASKTAGAGHSDKPPTTSDSSLC